MICHWSTVKRSLRYLKGMSDLGLLYGVRVMDMTALAIQILIGQVMWAIGYIFMLSVAGISRPLSSAEAEYVAVQEAIWLKRLIVELDKGNGQTEATVIYEDNQAATSLAKNHGQAKHIDI